MKDYNGFEVCTLASLPKDRIFYIIAHEATYSTDHGYPGHSESYSYLRFMMYVDRDEWEAYIKSVASAGHMKGRAFVMTPIEPTITVHVKVPEVPR